MAIAVTTFATYLWANRILPPMTCTWVAENTSGQIERWQLHKTQPNSQIVCRQMSSVITRLRKSCSEAAAMANTPWWPAWEGGGLMKKGAVERDLSQLVTGASGVILISCVYIYTYIIHTVPLYQQDGFTKYMSTEITLESASALSFPPVSLQQLPRLCKTHEMKGTVELQHNTIITSNRWAIRSELTRDWAYEAREESFGESVTMKVIQFSICTSDSEIQQQST